MIGHGHIGNGDGGWRVRAYVPLTSFLYRVGAPRWLVNLPGQLAFPVRSVRGWLRG